MTTKFVNIAYGNRKLPRRMTFNYKVKSNTYEVRMEGQPEYMLIFKPTSQKVMLDDASWCVVRDGDWAAAVVNPCSRSRNVIALGITPKGAYVEAVGIVW